MSLSHWTNADALQAYQDAYRRSLELWAIPYESVIVATPFGPTHVVVSGVDGEPIVLVHAASMSATQWYPQTSELGSAYRLYALDIMGDIGLSKQTAPIHSRAEAAAWLAAVLDGLGVGRAVFIGSSFGGFHSVNLAVHHPGLVRGLVLLAPAATIKSFKVLTYLAIRSGSLIPLPASVRPGLRAMMQGTLPDERIVRQMELGVAGFRYDRASIFPSEIPDNELAAIECPTLVLVGDKEMIYDSRKAVARTRGLIRDVHAEVVPDVGHLLGMQRPDIINQRVLAFLASAVSTRQYAANKRSH
jgi:pimeloyl-ACP methyl ester carboxylesterase